MLKIDNISLKFTDFSLNNISLQVNENECFSIIGPTGSGKSCILRAIAGVYSVLNGEISIRGRSVHDLPPEDRDVGLVFQHCALFSHLNVYDNIAFGLKIKKTDSNRIDRKVHEYAELFNIEHLLDRPVKNLSGGEKQRVALSRALITEPSVLLLDEPFSALDRVIHEKLMAEFKKIFKSKEMMVIHVTHDQGEACFLADRIGIIKNGKIVQTGTVNNVFKKPDSLFVANFVNMHNIYKGKAVRKQDGTGEILCDLLRIECEKIDQVGDIQFCIRPEYVYIYKNKPADSVSNVFRGIIKDISIIEAIVKTTVTINSKIQLTALSTVEAEENMTHKPGDKVFVRMHEKFIHTFT